MAFELPPVEPTAAAWDQWGTLAQQLTDVLGQALTIESMALTPESTALYEGWQAEWTAHTSTIYPWNPRRAGDWPFVRGGIEALVAEFRAAENGEDVRRYAAVFGVSCLLQTYCGLNGQNGALIARLRTHFQQPDRIGRLGVTRDAEHLNDDDALAAQVERDLALDEDVADDLEGDLDEDEELDDEDDLVWESRGDPDAPYVQEIFKTGEVRYTKQDGVASSFRAAERVTRWDGVKNKTATTFTVEEEDRKREVTRTELFGMYARRIRVG